MTVASVCMLVLVLVGWQAIGPGADYSPVAELSSRLIEQPFRAEPGS
jgi:hypothetical protein